VLVRKRPLLGEFSIVAPIDSASLPPLAELLVMDDRGEPQ